MRASVGVSAGPVRVSQGLGMPDARGYKGGEAVKRLTAWQKVGAALGVYLVFGLGFWAELGGDPTFVAKAGETFCTVAAIVFLPIPLSIVLAPVWVVLWAIYRIVTEPRRARRERARHEGRGR